MEKLTCKYTLIAFASHWGSKYGGINAFNADFLEAMGAAYYGKVNIICVVLKAEAENIEKAQQKNVILIKLPYEPVESCFTKKHAQSAINEIKKHGIDFDPNSTIWLGHDRISGEAALEAAQQVGGRSALIHHMSYDHYEAFSENAHTANNKVLQQKSLFKQADLVMAVGPLLRDALEDMIDCNVNMIVPGLVDIEPRNRTPHTFSMFVSGRLNNDALKVKQGQLAVAAFAKCSKEAKQENRPESLLTRPKLLLRGVDFELADLQDLHYSSSEKNLQKFAEGFANGVINLHCLPYTTGGFQHSCRLNLKIMLPCPSLFQCFVSPD